MQYHPGYFMAVVGGAVAGSAAAELLAKRGIYVALFEQRALPYGKIEDGLPKWHVKLRDKEEKKIDDRLSHPNIFYVPNTCLGDSLTFNQLVKEWGFSAVILACGAWRDRPLPVEGIDAFLGKGFYYQNPFVEWFNHNHESNYDGLPCDICDEAVVIGGGLASIDVAKILMLETTCRALQERGRRINIIELEHKGIPKALAEFGISFADLDVKGCTLYYRRRIIDMPISPIPENASPERIAKAHQVRHKILDLARKKYLFRFQPCSRPVRAIVESGALKGMVFEKTEIIDGRVVSVPKSEFDVRTPLIISSIGSIPAPISGIPTRGELFVIPNEDTGRMEGFNRVFAMGNAVTGRGNIRESELHAKKVANYIMDEFFAWTEERVTAIEARGWEVFPADLPRPPLPREKIAAIAGHLQRLQEKAGYDGDYRKWRESHLPIRLENM